LPEDTPLPEALEGNIATQMRKRGSEEIDEAIYREKQIQGWSRKKKEALIKGEFESLTHLAEACRGFESLSPRVA
jgi:hypothetical protein